MGQDLTNLPSATLAAFGAELSHADIPEEVMARAEDVLVDWLDSAFAVKFAEPVQTIAVFADLDQGSAGRDAAGAPRRAACSR